MGAILMASILFWLKINILGLGTCPSDAIILKHDTLRIMQYETGLHSSNYSKREIPCI
tara:strand:+ start:318 stop:491 length:174 start_codon:yes stop_codon:yes gene_type:complete